MGSYTETELSNLGNAALDFFLKGPALAQTLQKRPLLDALMSKKQTFGGGKEFIRKNVKGEYTTEFQGYSHDDTVNYVNPANIKQTQWKWYELHAGIGVTETELKADGISVVDDGQTSDHSDADLTRISAIFEDKLDDMAEGSQRSLNNICWRDGSQDPLVFPGIQAIIAGANTTGVTAGIDRAQNTWWRNRSLVGANKITSSTTSQTLTLTMQDELLQLRRYSDGPNKWLGGSTAFSALTQELRSKGNPFFTNFTVNGAMEMGQADINIVGLGKFVYDPTLDDLGLGDYMYMMSNKHVKMFVMEGEDMKKRTPLRPYNKYVLYRAVTLTALVAADQLNCNGVYQVARGS